jgi:hypothetical protein
MKSTRQFYKTKLTIEVLSEEKIPDSMSIEQIAWEATNGHYSMATVACKEKVMTGKQAANALLKQGSSPEFFQLNDKGEDVDN